MHGRHRPGNGYRSNTAGMTMSAGCVSPEGSVRVHKTHNSEYLNINRSYGRGQPKTYQLPQLSQKDDIFVEAGRLAAEYLVSKGLLPPSSLYGKWQNGSIKEQESDIREVRTQNGDNLQRATDGRPSAHSRLGNSIVDAGSRKRVSDEYNQTASRNGMRGRQRHTSMHNQDSDWGRENGRSWSLSGRTQAAQKREGDQNAVAGHQEDQKLGQDISGLQSGSTSNFASRSDDSKAVKEKQQVMDNKGSEASFSSTDKDPGLELVRDIPGESDGLSGVDVGNEELKDSGSNGGTENQDMVLDLPIQQAPTKTDPMSRNGNDLLRFCRFTKVPTRTRSSLACKGLKVDQLSTTEERDCSEIQASEISGLPKMKVAVDVPLDDDAAVQTHRLQCQESTISEAKFVQSANNAEECNSHHCIEGKYVRTRSFPSGAFAYEQKASQGPPGFGRSSSMDSMIKDRGEKRSSQDGDRDERSKKPREWLPSITTQGVDYVHLFNSSKKESSSLEKGVPSDDEVAAVTDDKKHLLDHISYTKAGDESYIEYAEEKQILPNSFKICDLNLVEAADVNDNRHSDQVFLYPSVAETTKETSPVDISLSTSHYCNASDSYDRYEAGGKEVEVIPLENNCVEDKPFKNEERKAEAAYSGLESFSDHPAPNNSDIPDTQDGYGLMISELLGNDIPNCSPVQADIDPLNNEMGLHSREVQEILSEDDPIYMSLGEIPISFLPVWDQQPQEYEKFL